MNATPRLRMFAGPNGSGKSTMKSLLSSEMLGVYINPDDIEREIREHNFFDVESYGVYTSSQEILAFFGNSTLLKQADLLDEAEHLRFNEGKLSFFAVGVNAYFASVAADFLRQKLLDASVSFTFETVMSAPDKVSLLQKAQRSGYRTYLYYVATEDPSINIRRVRDRVAMGGHAVPEDKIVTRYHRSLDLLIEAIRHTHRTYIFDNSAQSLIWLAEITEGKTIEMKAEHLPVWFEKAVWDKFQ
jgi:predicted ABC-type ATPase